MRKYITFEDLSKTIRNNFYKIPHDIDFVVGVPRSGVICGSIISEFLNVPLIDSNSFAHGATPTGGYRLHHYDRIKQQKLKQKVLVVDDTVYGGTSMRKTKTLLNPLADNYNFIYMAVYMEGFAKDVVDLYLEDVSCYTNNCTQCVLYEWNIFHHNEKLMNHCIYDIDGVLCLNPPDERNEEEYLKYIKNATPLFTPTAKIGEVLTYRLSKNREITEQWLKDNKIEYGKLTMFEANTWEERNKSGIKPEVFKGVYYKNNTSLVLFVESDDYQAKRIAEISGKPVYCVETNRMYQ